MMMLENRRVLPALLLAVLGVFAIAARSSAQSIATNADATRLQLTDRKQDAPKAKLVLYTTMATWCAPCKAELPQFSYLRSVFKPEELAMFGLPYDDKEGVERLNAWAAANRPSYELLASLTKDNIGSVKAMVLKTLSIDALPATIVTDTNGRILRARLGPPSASELRELLRSQRDRK